MISHGMKRRVWNRVAMIACTAETKKSGIAGNLMGIESQETHASVGPECLFGQHMSRIVAGMH
jgi:hypothetical protein